MTDRYSKTGLRIFFLFLLFHLFPSHFSQTLAQELTGVDLDQFASLLEFEASEYKSEGKINGCGFEYSLISRDYTYNQGKLTLIIGSINTFYVREKDLNVSIKVLGKNMSVYLGQPPVFENYLINYAYIGSSNFSSAGKETSGFRCEDGGYCAIYSGLKIFEDTYSSIMNNDFYVAYNRRQGGLDVQVDLSPDDLKGSSNQLLRFSNCLVELMKRYEKQD